jgi:protein-tyrosine-phosphatase
MAETKVSMHSILFICSANMCRSPMAEALFANLLKQRATDMDWQVSSAGVWAYDGNRASEGAVKALQRIGIDLSNHRSQSISKDMMLENDLILVMERNHKEALQAAYPKLAYKIYLLAEMVGMSHDILDPIGGSAADYEDTAAELELLLTDAFPRIEKLVNKRKEDLGK